MKPAVPFWVAILTTVVGLLIVTGGFLIFYDLHWGQRSIELLKADYLDQVANTAEKEEAATGRVMSATRVDGKELALTLSDPRIHGGVPKQFRADTLAPLLHRAPLAGSLGRDAYRRAIAEPETIVWIPHDTSAGLALGITTPLAVQPVQLAPSTSNNTLPPRSTWATASRKAVSR